MGEVAPEIVAFYNEAKEVGRLSVGLGRLEFARLTELLSRYLPSTPATVIDVGGGPGAYACWLARCGYAVHLIDPVALHITQALEASARQPAQPLASCDLADARELPFEDATCDAVVLHGPLYHLTERADRIQAWAEARRVLRPGGVVCAVAISRSASTVVGIVKGWIWDAAYLQMVREEIGTGQHRRPDGWRVFTTAYFHDPSELRHELSEAGFQHEATIGIQGPGWLAPGFDQIDMGSPQFAALTEIARLVEHEPALSPHFLALAWR